MASEPVAPHAADPVAPAGGRRVWLAAILALAVLGIVGLSWHRYVTLERELTETALARHAAVGSLTASTLAVKLERLLDVGVALATRVRFQQLVAAGRWSEAGQILQRVPEDFDFLDRLFLADVRGTLLADVPPVPEVRGKNFAHRDWFKGVSRSWRPYVSQLYRRSAAPRRDVIAAAVPIRGPGDGVTGILVLQVKLETFFDWARRIDLGAASRVLIVDAAWRTAFDSQSPAGAQREDGAADPLVRRLAPGALQAQVVRDAPSGRELVLGFAPAAHGWGVVTLQDGASAFAARDALLRQMLLDGAMIVLFAIAAIVLATTVVMQRRREEVNRAHRAELERAQEALARQAERLQIMHEIDRAIIAAAAPQAIAGAVIRPLRELLGVPRAIVNLFDLAAGEVEWLAAAGRRRTRSGPGVRYSIRLMGDVEALKRGEPQVIDTQSLPPGPEVVALLASGVKVYMAVPMIAGGELIGALSFGGEQESFPKEQVLIAQEVATQLAIAIAQARLLERVKRNAEELEIRVRERTSALEALNRELDDLYDNAPCGYHSVGENGLFVRMNQTELNWLGYTRDEVIGKMGPADLHTPASLEIFKRRFKVFRETGVAKDVEYEFRRKDGSVLPVVLNATAVRDRDGNFLMSRSTIFDNTDRKRAAEQLEAANKELESFSYSVSHDLRSPLRAIDGFSRIVLEDYAARLDAEGRRLLGVIRDNSRKMGELIDDLLEYSRLGRKPLASAEIDMKRLVEEVLGELPASSGSSPRLELGALPPARGDATLLKQAWTNLLANAVKFSSKREQPVIAVSGHENGAQCVYCVKDNGAGFDMRYREKLFNVFQRLHREDEFEGTGVGLAIVQRVIARHGGRVWAEGKVDAGAGFYFSLPKEGPDGKI